MVRSGGGIEERNFKKWKVLLKFFNRENPDFSYKHLAMYGCQCGALGKDGKYDFYGRGAGQALDELDEACKEYSSCLKERVPLALLTNDVQMSRTKHITLAGRKRCRPCAVSR